jgi:hypothetical protein
LKTTKCKLNNTSASLFGKKEWKFFFEKELTQSRAILEKENYRDSKFYFKNYELGLEEAGFTAAHLRNENKNFQATADSLSISFVANILKIGCEIQSHQTMSEQVYNLKLLPQVLDLIESNKFKMYLWWIYIFIVIAPTRI